MAAAFGRGRAELAPAHKRLEEIAARAVELRALSLELADEELTSYEPVLAALRLPPADPARADRLAAAQSGAARAPLAVAAVGSELAQLAQEVAALGSHHLLGDAHTALLLAEAACQAAAGLVAINLESHPEDERRSEARELARRAQAVRAEVFERPAP
jgi:formiminotetrahydrofolate cyclodeaminase